MSPKDKVALIGNLHLLERISQLTMLADSDEEYLEELAGKDLRSRGLARWNDEYNPEIVEWADAISL
jgi:hypothetical protein